MGIADARAMHPSIEVLEADPAADRRLLESLADWCDRYTPLVAVDGDDGLFLDITGCTHLFGGERAMLDDILSRFFQQGFEARIGLASTPGAAWAAARYRASTIVGPGEEEALLAPLPLAALRLDAECCAGLESVGLRTVGAILSAPRAPLARRFGRILMTRLDQAVGRLDEAISPRLPVAPLSVERRLAEPISLTEDIERLVALLADGLVRDLERRCEGARTLQLALFRVDGAVTRLSVGTSRPLRDARRIEVLFKERLMAPDISIDAGYGFDLVRLSVLAAARFETEQTDLGGRRTDESEELALLADRLCARLGAAAIQKTIAVQSHIPERAALPVPFGEVTEKASTELHGSPLHGIAAERPIRLFRHPEPVEVTAGVPEDPPANFRWRRTLYRVSRAEGPERIAPEWWRDDACEIRDYFRVEDMDGRRYWLFREGLHQSSRQPPRWFMHGIFA